MEDPAHCSSTFVELNFNKREAKNLNMEDAEPESDVPQAVEATVSRALR